MKTCGQKRSANFPGQPGGARWISAQPVHEERRVGLDNRQYFCCQACRVAPPGLPTFDSIHAGTQRFCHLRLRNIKLSADGFHISNFIARRSGWGLVAVFDLNSLFQGRFKFVEVTHFKPHFLVAGSVS